MIWYQLSSVFVTGYTGDAPVVQVKEDNVELVRKSTVTDMTAGSFYHDTESRLLYLWPAGSDNPGSNGKTYMLYVWLGFCDTEAAFPIQGEPETFYRPVVDLANSPAFSQTITELFSGNISFDFGQISMIDPEWFYLNRNNYIWINSQVYVKYGELGRPYGEYQEIQSALINGISFTDAGVSLTLIDIRRRLYTTIPPDRFLKSDFPYINPDILYNARAVLVGEKKGITANLVNTRSHTYEISQVEFDFKTFTGIEEVSAVYKDGILLATPADYSIDLANAQFILTAAAGDSLVTCDAKGLTIGRDFAGSTWTDIYKSDVASILYFYLRIQGITDTYIDPTGLLELQEKKAGVECGDWLFQETEFEDKAKELQATGLFHLVTGAGRIKVKPYSITEPPAIRLGNEYFKDFKIGQTPEIINRLLVRYDRAPVLDTTETEEGSPLAKYKYVRVRDKQTANIYQSTKMRSYRTIINNQPAAEGTAAELIELFNRPPEPISFSTNHELINFGVLDKLGITYYITVDGQRQYIYQNESFIITKIGTNWNGYINITARKDADVIQGTFIEDHDFITITDHDGDPLEN